ncbi:MAG: type IX secretion system outer membrane channel protein PorV [Bacteroidetes bacterium]|nr:MAG: type IX secretion system outer membrane channel protein PorV [Bacteroidota bacterium]TNF01004.1 MAG: type IX secretion system outer membrane channel protein PorV [Bacteroidota bacterium]
MKKMHKVINSIGSIGFVMISFIGISQPTGSGVTSNDLQLNTITTAMPFLAITPDSRAGGMGDAGTALSADANSVYWNTSMLNFAKSKSEIAVSYTPWLRQLTNDIHLSYVSGYYKFNERHTVGGALRYFSLGNITFTSDQGDVIRDDKPNEFELVGAYAFRTSERTSVGINGKFAYSNLTGGLPVAGVDTKAGVVGGADISFTYRNDDAKIGGTNGIYTFAATINNIGNKVKYTNVGSNSPGDFIPMNLKIGNSFLAEFDKYNNVVFAIDIQKLLVPTPAFYDFNSDGDYILMSGMTNDVGVIAGMIQSFYDAPGRIAEDEGGNYIQNPDGSYQVVKGSKLKEELSEINIATGLEYWYNNLFALRGGFFYESKNKGARQFFNFGVGLKYNKFGIDISYLAALQRQNPLANTLRFTLRMTLGEGGSTSASAKPE